MLGVDLTKHNLSDLNALQKEMFKRSDDILANLASKPVTAADPKSLVEALQIVEGLELLQKELGARDRFEVVDGHRAVVGRILVKGQSLDTLLSEGAFNLTREAQEEYAKQLGYRLASFSENKAYALGLVKSEADATISSAGRDALNTYTERSVRDTETCAWSLDRRKGEAPRPDLVFAPVSADQKACPKTGALFVRESRESPIQ